MKTQAPFFVLEMGYKQTPNNDDSGLLSIASTTIDRISISSTGEKNVSCSLNKTLTIASNALLLIISVIVSDAFNVIASWKTLWKRKLSILHFRRGRLHKFSKILAAPSHK